MANIPWIKICTDIFDDEKIALIDSMPDRDAILVIWFKLLCMAGKQNNGGVFMLTDKMAYTDEMLSTIFRRPINTVRLALQTFEQFGMVSIENKAYTLPNWEKHQSLDKLEAAKEKNRQRVAAHREKQKMLAQCNDYSNVTVMQCNAVEEDKDKDKEIDKDKIDYKGVVDLYHSICISFPSVKKITERRKAAIRARFNAYNINDFRTVFEKAEASSFLKGGNDRNWTADFDWLINDANMAKVLEDKYVDKQQRRYGGRKEPVPGWCKSELGDAELEAIQNILKDDTVTVGNNQELADRAEKLKERLQGGGV